MIEIGNRARPRRTRGTLARASRRAVLGLVFVAVASVALAQSGGTANSRSLRAALDALAAKHKIAIQGIDTIVADQPAPAAAGSPLHQIEALLANYNYMLVRKSGEGVESVLIIGRKSKVLPPPEGIEVETSRRGAHHMVIAELTGPNGNSVTVPLVVDTGASTIVLPASLMARMGFEAAELRDSTLETANQRVPGKKAVLASAQIGDAVERDVAVTFIEDERLRGTMLLGMSFLGRYRMTIDDADNRITLTKAR